MPNSNKKVKLQDETQEPSLACLIPPSIMTTTAQDVSALAQAKESVALIILLRLTQNANLETSEDGGQMLTTYRRNLQWTLLQPASTSIRSESWKWILYLVDAFPTVMDPIVQIAAHECKVTLNFLKESHTASSQAWLDQVFRGQEVGTDGTVKEEKEKPVLIPDWVNEVERKGRDTTEMANTILHHCAIYKLLQSVLAACDKSNIKAKQVLMAL